MAKRKIGPHLIIANRLTDGAVLFLAEDGGWTPDAARAATAEGDGLDKLEATAEAAAKANTIVDPQAVPALEEGGPAHMKQQMQVRGPSVRPDLGYQAEAPQGGDHVSV